MSMEKTREVSDELLNAFVDDELDAAEKARLLNRMAESPGLRERICQLWQIKEQVRGAYPLQGAPTKGRKNLASPLGRYSQALAASLVLAVGAALGWIAHDEQGGRAGLHLTERQVAEGKVILHLASSDPDRLKATLDEAEALSQEHDKSGRPVRVEVLANGGGINLLRASVSPYAERVESLAKQHSNLSFLACNTAIERLRENGADVRLLPHVAIAPSALDQIMMRLQQGWTYVQV
jgi:intracellular sulfur oxidation DsrE/DsrF family protein